MYIEVEEHVFLRKIITEKYQQKVLNWIPPRGNANRYTDIADHIRLSTRKHIGSNCVSAYQMHKLFNLPESNYRHDFIYACYLYCDLKRNIKYDKKENVLIKEDEDMDTLKREVEDLKAELDSSTEEADDLKTEVNDYKMRLQKSEKENESLHREITKQKEENESLKTNIVIYQGLVKDKQTQVTEYEKVAQHYSNLSKSYNSSIEHQKTASERKVQELMQLVATLKEENQRLALVDKKTKSGIFNFDKIKNMFI